MALMRSESVKEPVSTEIRVMGKTFAVRSEFDQQFMTETANLVNAKMNELVQKAGSVSVEKVAILTAMNLAGELLQERKNSVNVRDSVRRKARKLLELIDSNL